MKCLTFPFVEKLRFKTTKSIPSGYSSTTTFTNIGPEISAEFDSVNVSNTSAEFRSGSTLCNSSQIHNSLRAFTYTELKVATKKFNHSNKLGEGGFGCVHKGVIRDLEDPTRKIDVTVKQLSRRGSQGHKEWITEVNVLGVVEHPNLVKLIGYCAEDDERGIQRLLIYEYIPNRSVDDHLSDPNDTTLTWRMRLKIAQDAARGLTYLHEQMDFQIIFRDFKSSNILLDEEWNGKLSDFGLARLGPTEGLSHVSTAVLILLVFIIKVVGTYGYASPEYIQTGHLTAKNDVWSYGVFLYELITGRRPLDRDRPKSEQKLLVWVKLHLDSKKFRHIIDPRLGQDYSLVSVQKLSFIANRCLSRRSKTRPTMSRVLEMVNQVAAETM